MKKLLFVILACLIYALPGQAQQWVGIQAQFAPTIVQEQTEWCWAAVVTAVRNYYGFTTTQATIVFNAHGNTGNAPGSDRDITISVNDQGIMPDGSVMFLHGAELPGMLSPQILYNNLSTFHPVIVAIVTGASMGHAIVITAASFVQTPNGVAVSSLVYSDPASGSLVELSGPALSQFVSTVRSSWVTWTTR